MNKHASLWFIFVFVFASISAFATVTVSSPTNGSTVGSSVNFVANASTSCSKGVATMGIYPTTNALAYVGDGNHLNTTLNLNPGTYSVTVTEWDYCGGATNAKVNITVNESAGVHVTSPANNATVNGAVNFVATSTTTCPKGIASMGIYTAPGQLAYVSNGASLNHSLSLSPGTYNTTVQEWDNCGGAAKAAVTVKVSGTSSGNTFYNLQAQLPWEAAAQQPPNYADCNSCTPSGPGTTWSVHGGISNPSLSGKATQFNLGGDMAYSDVLWDNHLIGDLSSQGMPDSNHTLVPKYSNFTYDVYFYGTNLEAAQALEFDVSQYFNGMGFTWGTECRTGGGNEWDIWDSHNKNWVPTGVACNPVNNQWNHLVLHVSRTSNNQEYYQSITLNGKTANIGKSYGPFSAPGWWGIVVNYQMDGNYKQTPYTVYVDNLNFTYN